MRLVSEVTEDKLRGGYYTPDFVVDACIDRAQALLGGASHPEILEPSAGDGSFVRGIAKSEWRRGASMVCVEKCAAEAAKCQQRAHADEIACSVVPQSFFAWSDTNDAQFDCVLGNPPFIRYQFVPPEERKSAEAQLKRQNLELAGVSNLYIPFVLLSMLRLRAGGAFAMVLPSEVLCTTSGEQVRSALLANLDDMQVDLFPREAFPDILQDIAVFSGRKRYSPSLEGQVRFAEHTRTGVNTWAHRVTLDDRKWMRFLLDHAQLDVLREAQALEAVARMGDVAKFSVSIVTGANAYFTVDSQTVAANQMDTWAKPLMARSYDSPGLVFRADDHASAVSHNRRAWLLDFEAQAPDPEAHEGAAAYLRSGEGAGLAERYKCRIRSPWYRVPHVWAGELMMSKRASLHHRVILNEASVLTTDTVYRGAMLPSYAGRERDLVAGFHNSLTLLSAEIEGRTYGGGVLELVPSEISALLVPMLPTNGHLETLDVLSRAAGGQRDPEEQLVHATNQLLAQQMPRLGCLLQPLEAARQRLRARRFDELAPSYSTVSL
jgi:adenine-specific DNA-methyltransferase